MNRMFRTATRTLGWSLIALLSMVVIVLVNGIDPQVQVAFKPLNRETTVTSNSKPTAKVTEPPEFFAQAKSESRLDVSTGIRSVLNGKTNPRVMVKPSPRQRPGQTADLVTIPETELPSLPPFPIAPDDSASETAPPQGPGPSLVELPDPEIGESQKTEVAQAEPRKTVTKPETTKKPAPEAKSPLVTEPRKTTAEQDSSFVAQLTAIQEQLSRIAAAQEQNHQSSQSWLESHQLLHQRELQRKLDGIEAGLRELQTKSERMPGALKEELDKHTPRGTIIRQDKVISSEPGGGGTGPAIVRNMLESLADKSNLNVVFSINVEGDVEMTMQDSAGRPALDALRQIPGYVLEKEGRKIQVPSPEPKQYQREAFLPPIVNDPPAPVR